MGSIDGELIVAVCSVVGTAAGTFGGIRLMSYRIEQLEKQIEKLGEVIDRTYRLEHRAELAEERINAAAERLGKLERRIGSDGENSSERRPCETGTG